MATIIKNGLTALNIKATLNVAGQSYIGINVGGTYVGTVSFEVTYNGSTWLPLSLEPYPGGTAVSSTTTTGFWFKPIVSGPAGGTVTPPIAVRANMTAYTSGTALVTLGASTDNSFIDVSLAANVLQQSQSSSAATAQTVTQAASTTHSWQLKSLLVTTSGTITAGKTVTVKDGTNTIWVAYLPVITGGGGPTPQIPLPPGGLVGTVNNALNIIVAALDSSIISTVDISIGCA